MVGDTESKNYKKYHEVMYMIGNGRFGWTIVHYKGDYIFSLALFSNIMLNKLFFQVVRQEMVCSKNQGS